MGRVSEGSRHMYSQRTTFPKQVDEVTMVKKMANVLLSIEFDESFVVIRQDRFGRELDGMNLCRLMSIVEEPLRCEFILSNFEHESERNHVVA
jgi:hypothetical protein